MSSVAIRCAAPDDACAICAIYNPYERSVALHERLGFRKVAHFSEVGRKFGRWVDVGYWELRLQD